MQATLQTFIRFIRLKTSLISQNHAKNEQKPIDMR